MKAYPSNRQEAIDYAHSLTRLHGELWIPFETPKGTAAYNMGVKFGAIKETERADYEAGGAKIIESRGAR